MCYEVVIPNPMNLPLMNKKEKIQLPKQLNSTSKL